MTHKNTKVLLQGIPFAMLCSLVIGAAATAAQPPPLKPEASDVATLAPAGPHRFFTVTFDKSIVIFDGDSGKLEGQVPAAHDSNFAIAPDNSRFYIAETMWTHGNRGERVDLLSVYDGRTLNLVKEISLPGRAIIGMKLKNLDLSASGKRAYVYNMHPASSVSWVDLTTQAVAGTVELPGCALVFAWGDEGFSSLCGDGSLATVSLADSGPAKVTHTAPFFDAANDPIFDNSLVDRSTGKAFFLTYTGLIYEAKLGPQPMIEKPWSILEAAGQKAAGTGVDELAWRPGGVQPIAWHKDSDRLFVLMHPGNYWSHLRGGTEIWAVNVKTHSVVSRIPVLVTPAGTVKSIAVSQRAKPQLYLLNPDGGDTVVDADSGEVIRKIDFAGGEAALVPGF
jgi:methylamine dehydrogenase heavy chain